MTEAPKASARDAHFSEKEFYLDEFRGRSLAIAVPGRGLDGAALADLEAVLADLAANRTRVLLLCGDSEQAARILAEPPLASEGAGWVGALWRRLLDRPCVALAPGEGELLAGFCRRITLRLRLAKLVWIGAEGLLRSADGRPVSLVDLGRLDDLVREQDAAEPGRKELLAEIREMIAGGLPSVSACAPGELAAELFTYLGSGTLYSRERYIEVRPFSLDDFDGVAHLIQRGVDEGYLLPRSSAELEAALTHGFGAFVEGSYLAGICSLLPHPSARAGEIASLYTLTRFVGEGVGGNLVRFALERSREQDFDFVYACTTSERVEAFFQGHGFRSVAPGDIPEEKWQGYSKERRQRVRCLRLDF